MVQATYMKGMTVCQTLPNRWQKCPVGAGQFSPSPQVSLELDPPWVLNMLNSPNSKFFHMYSFSFSSCIYSELALFWALF